MEFGAFSTPESAWFAVIGWVWACLALVWAVEPVPIDAGLVAHVEDSVGTAVVRRIESHPEYQRYWLEDPEGKAFVAELTWADGVHHGLCEAHGLVLFPRPELVEGDLAAVTVQSWCDVLAATKPENVTLVARGHQGPLDPASAPAPSGPTAPRWLTELVAASGLLAAVAFLWTIRREGGKLLAIFVAAAAFRLGTSDAVLWNGGGAAYEKLLLAWGEMRGAPYGGGYTVWMAPAVRLMGGTFAAIAWSNLIYSALTVVAMVRLAMLETPRIGSLAERRRLPWFMAIAAGALPVWVFLSQSELMHVSGVFFAVTAVVLAAETRLSRSPLLPAVGSFAAYFAAFSTRPDLGVAVLPVVAFGFSVRRWWFAALSLALAALLKSTMDAPSLLGTEQLASAASVWRALVFHVGPPRSEGVFQLFLHSAFTPAAWWGAAALGFFALPWATRLRLLVWMAASVPFWTKVVPLADAVRLQLFVQAAWCFLVGAGLVRLGPWLGSIVGFGPAIFQLVYLPLRWANHDEFRFLSEVVPTLSADTVVRAEAFGHRNDAFVRVMRSLGPAAWVTKEASLRPEKGQVVLRYRSVGEPEPLGTPVFTRALRHETDLDLSVPEGPVVVGFYAESGSVVPTASTGQDSTAN